MLTLSGALKILVVCLRRHHYKMFTVVMLEMEILNFIDFVLFLVWN